MEEPYSIIPTLEHLVEYLLDFEAQLHDLSAVWLGSLMVNLPWIEYLQAPPLTRVNSQQVQVQMRDLRRLIDDSKQVIMEFIPNHFQAIPVQVNGQVYFVSKVKRKDNQSSLLVVRQKDKR